MFGKKVCVDNLRGVPLFERCTERELERIARSGTERRFAAGTTLAEQDTEGREAFVVLDGAVVVRRNQRVVATLGPGSIVGELALLDSGTRTATLSCEVESAVFVIDQRQFRGVLDDVPSMAHKLAASLCGRIRVLDANYYG
jgi:CRP-like cAMP-binding protein